MKKILQINEPTFKYSFSDLKSSTSLTRSSVVSPIISSIKAPEELNTLKTPAAASGWRAQESLSTFTQCLTSPFGSLSGLMYAFPGIQLNSLSLLGESFLLPSEVQSDISELLSEDESFPDRQPESLLRSSDALLASDSFLCAPGLRWHSDVALDETFPVRFPVDLTSFPESHWPDGVSLAYELLWTSLEDDSFLLFWAETCWCVLGCFWLRSAAFALLSPFLYIATVFLKYFQEEKWKSLFIYFINHDVFTYVIKGFQLFEWRSATDCSPSWGLTLTRQDARRERGGEWPLARFRSSFPK